MGWGALHDGLKAYLKNGRRKEEIRKNGT